MPDRRVIGDDRLTGLVQRLVSLPATDWRRNILLSQKAWKTRQNLLVFCRSNPKATEACGEVEFSDEPEFELAV